MRATSIPVTITVFLLCLGGCHHGAGGASDLGSSGGDDLGISDGDGGGGDGGANGDLAGAPGDLGGPPDFAGQTCLSPGTTTVSGQTRPRMTYPLSATDGSTTMVVWSIYPGSSFVGGAWAEVQNGAVRASGDLPVGGDIGPKRLFTWKSAYYLFHAGDRKLYQFDGTKWNAVLTGVDDVAVGSAQILGVGGRPSAFAPTTAVFWDGTAASAPQQISSHSFLGVASDGGSVFGVVTLSGSTLGFLTYDGNAWSTESTVGTIPSGSTLDFVNLAHSGTLWCFDYSLLGSGWTAWVGAASTWSSTSGSQAAGAVAANNGSFAIASSDGNVAVYSNGSWTATTLGASGDSQFVVQPFGSGYVYVHAGISGGVKASLFDGSQWGTSSTVVAGPAIVTSGITVVVDGSTIALGIDSNRVASYESGAWTTPATLTTASQANVAGLGLTISGSEIDAVFPEPGAMTLRRRTSGTWGTPLALPASPTSGPVSSAAVARARNGHALAAWTQWDAGIVYTYASEYDGCTWQTPVQLTNLRIGTTIAVVATGATFLISEYSGAATYVLRWSGAGNDTPTQLGNGKVGLASDGATFVAVWADAGGNLVWSTSSDGATWATAQQLEAGPGWSVSDAVGGPAGVVETSALAGGAANQHARVWQGGAWSASTALTVGSVFTCRSAVGSASALVACSGNSSADAELFAAGAWTDVPLTAAVSYVPQYAALGTDGADYRLDFAPVSPSQPVSAVLHAGAWSTPAQGDTLGSAAFAGVRGQAGAWMLAASTTPGDFFVARASGSAGYSAAAVTTLSTVQGPVLASGFGAGWPGETDLFWVGNTPTWKSVSVLYVGLGL